MYPDQIHYTLFYDRFKWFFVSKWPPWNVAPKTYTTDENQFEDCQTFLFRLNHAKNKYNFISDTPVYFNAGDFANPFDGEIISAHLNDGKSDYNITAELGLILEHEPHTIFLRGHSVTLRQLLPFFCELKGIDLPHWTNMNIVVRDTHWNILVATFDANSMLGGKTMDWLTNVLKLA